MTTCTIYEWVVGLYIISWLLVTCASVEFTQRKNHFNGNDYAAMCIAMGMMALFWPIWLPFAATTYLIRWLFPVDNKRE